MKFSTTPMVRFKYHLAKADGPTKKKIFDIIHSTPSLAGGFSDGSYSGTLYLTPKTAAELSEALRAVGLTEVEEK